MAFCHAVLALLVAVCVTVGCGQVAVDHEALGEKGHGLAFSNSMPVGGRGVSQVSICKHLLHRVEFFNIRSAGDRVAFVIDASGTMFRTFDYVRAELSATIDALDPSQEFIVIFFNERMATAMPPEDVLQYRQATAEEKKRAIESILAYEIKAIEVNDDSNNLLRGMKLAFKLPDCFPKAVYLLACSEVAEETIIDILKENRQKSHIHTIAWLNTGIRKLLEEVACRNGGQFRFVSDEDCEHSVGMRQWRVAPTSAPD